MRFMKATTLQGAVIETIPIGKKDTHVGFSKRKLDYAVLPSVSEIALGFIWTSWTKYRAEVISHCFAYQAVYQCMMPHLMHHLVQASAVITNVPHCRKDGAGIKTLQISHNSYSRHVTVNPQ